MNSNQSSGTPFALFLTIVLVALKLTGVINLAWIWVLAPLWITFALAVIILIFGGMIFGLISLIVVTLDRLTRSSRRNAELDRLAKFRQRQAQRNDSSYNPDAPTSKTLSEKFFSRSK